MIEASPKLSNFFECIPVNSNSTSTATTTTTTNLISTSTTDGGADFTANNTSINPALTLQRHHRQPHMVH